MQNEAGEEYDLNGGSTVYLNDPAGLGIYSDNSYSAIGRGFFRNVDSDHPQQEAFTGTLVFWKNAYQSYRDFVNWAAAAKTLFIIYEPYPPTRYFAQIEINYLTKNEIKEGTWLKVPAAFSYLTPWYLPQDIRLAFNDPSADASAYPGYYDTDAVYAATTAGNYETVIAPDGQWPASIVLSYTGPAENPVITLTGQSTGKEYGKALFDLTMAAGDTLTLSTKYLDSFARLVKSNNTVIDLYDTNAISAVGDPFFKVPITEPTILTLADDGILSGSVSATMNTYYRSV